MNVAVPLQFSDDLTFCKGVSARVDGFCSSLMFFSETADRV